MAPGLAGLLLLICKLSRFPGLIPFGLGHNHWFLFVVVTCFIITLFWIFFYLLQIREHIKVSHRLILIVRGTFHINVAKSLIGSLHLRVVYRDGQSYLKIKVSYSTDRRFLHYLAVIRERL
jgi:hypothetical protein